MSAPLVIIAGGPSLTAEDVNRVLIDAPSGVACWVINDSWRVAPWADLLYACDRKWWDIHHDSVALGYRGECWTQDPGAAARYGLNYIKSRHGGGLAESGPIYQGGNSGHQAINLAYRFGHRQILLLGYDMQLGPDGKKHWHGDHPAPLNNLGNLRQWVGWYGNLAHDAERLGVEIINCSRATALECFPRMSIEEGLDAFARTAPV